ncbi:hypothetical protein HYR99_16530, partial [Candidatus Poribacteria bacterium]|nr:hypothetical protein [Candidatus Poribacteria bacterium]
DDFPGEKEIKERIKHAIDFVLSMKEIHKGPLMRPYNFYSLVLAISHVRKPVKTLMSLYEPRIPYHDNQNLFVTNLTSLAEVLQNPDSHLGGKFKEFVHANLSHTNDTQNRQKRFEWFCKALEPNLL